MEPADAVRRALNLSLTATLFSCYTPDATTIRMWNYDAGWEACATKIWRTSEWLVTGGDACECTIPYRLSLTGKYDVRNASTDIGNNLRRTLDQMRFRDVAFLTDSGCISLLRVLEEEEVFRGWALTDTFMANDDGRIRSDICRLAMLWTRGGYYFDNDLVLLDNVLSHIPPDATFVSITTVRGISNPPGLFNAFIATTPRNPIVYKALLNHAKFLTLNDKFRITRNRHQPNIGTVLLRDALRSVIGDTEVYKCERTGYCDKGIQLFREIALEPENEYNTSGLCHICEVTHGCNFAVVDVPSGDVLMKSRVAIQNTVVCPVWCAPSPLCVPPPTLPRKRKERESFLSRLLWSKKS